MFFCAVMVSCVLYFIFYSSVNSFIASFVPSVQLWGYKLSFFFAGIGALGGVLVSLFQWCSVVSQLGFGAVVSRLCFLWCPDAVWCVWRPGVVPVVFVVVVWWAQMVLGGVFGGGLLARRCPGCVPVCRSGRSGVRVVLMVLHWCPSGVSVVFHWCPSVLVSFDGALARTCEETAVQA